MHHRLDKEDKNVDVAGEWGIIQSALLLPSVRFGFGFVVSSTTSMCDSLPISSPSVFHLTRTA
jgi:hypothetical protein